MWILISKILATIVNLATAYLNHKMENHKTAMFSMFFSGMVFASFLESLIKYLHN